MHGVVAGCSAFKPASANTAIETHQSDAVNGELLQRRSRSTSSNLSYSFAGASATLGRQQREGATQGTNPTSPLANGSSGGAIGPGSMAAASEDASQAAPNPYTVFVKAAAPSSPSRQNAPVADAAAAPNPYMKFAAAGAAESAGSSAQGVLKRVPSASRLSDTAQAAGVAAAANPYARFQQAAAARTASPPPPPAAAAAAASSPYERFLQPAASKTPATANGAASVPAKATESAGAAASLEAVALLATQTPADVEARLVLPVV